MEESGKISDWSKVTLQGYARAFWTLRRLAGEEGDPKRKAELNRDADNFRVLFKINLGRSRRKKAK